MELSPHNRGFQLVMPDLCSPITNRQEVMKHTTIRVSLAGVNGTKVPSTLKSKAGHDLHWFLSSCIDCAYGAQFSSNKEFSGTGVDVKSDVGSSADGLCDVSFFFGDPGGFG
jgi:hypothetical protein